MVNFTMRHWQRHYTGRVSNPQSKIWIDGSTVHDAEYGPVLIVCGKNFALRYFLLFILIENNISGFQDEVNLGNSAISDVLSAAVVPGLPKAPHFYDSFGSHIVQSFTYSQLAKNSNCALACLSNGRFFFGFSIFFDTYQSYVWMFRRRMRRSMFPRNPLR